MNVIIRLQTKRQHSLSRNDVGDPEYEMYRQATLGDVDFITGDYLAGMFLGMGR